MGSVDAGQDDTWALACVSHKQAWTNTSSGPVSDEHTPATSAEDSPAAPTELTLALLSLPDHHLHAVLRCLLASSVLLSDLLVEVPFVLHRALVHATATMSSSSDAVHRRHGANGSASKSPICDVGAQSILHFSPCIDSSSHRYSQPSIGDISNAARAALCAQLPFVSRLSAVDLSGQQLGEDGVAAVTLALSQQSLTRLNLARQCRQRRR